MVFPKISSGDKDGSCTTCCPILLDDGELGDWAATNCGLDAAVAIATTPLAAGCTIVDFTDTATKFAINVLIQQSALGLKKKIV